MDHVNGIRVTMQTFV